MLISITYDTDTGITALQFTPPERRGRNNMVGHAILQALTEKPFGKTTRELIEWAWPDPDHEPREPEDCIRHAVAQLNRGYLPIYHPYLRVVGDHRLWRLVIRRGDRVQAPGSE